MALIRASSGSGGGGETSVVLWENPTPSAHAGFTGTSISLSDSVSNYDYIKILWGINPYNVADNQLLEVMVKAEISPTIATFNNKWTLCVYKGSATYIRYFEITASTTITLTNATVAAAVIPIKVIGIKL